MAKKAEAEEAWAPEFSRRLTARSANQNHVEDTLCLAGGIAPVRNWEETRMLRMPWVLAAVTVLAVTMMTVSLAPAASAATPAKTDVLLVFDTSGSMTSALEAAKGRAVAVADGVNASMPEVQFAVAEMRDYSDAPPYPWHLVQPLTADRTHLQAAVDGLSASGGGDNPEAYGRALYEADQDPAVGWRSGARHLVILVADDVPHDNDLNEGVPADIISQPSPWNTGVDPGRDGSPGTADDIDWQPLLAQLRDHGLPLMYVLFQGDQATLRYWQHWAGLTGGGAAASDSTTLVDTVVGLIKQGATSELPTCAAGQARGGSGRCVALTKVPVVLVPGLNENVPGLNENAAGVQAPDHKCENGGPFVKMCHGLIDKGHPVWVVPAQPDAARPILNNRGFIDENAQRLRTYLANAKLPGRPLLVGHSMGGLIARVAISRHNVSSSGLVTIGTPHDGSFLPDIIAGTLIAPCAHPVCVHLKAFAIRIAVETGAAALADLTFAARQWDNILLSSPRVPVTTVFGTPIDPVPLLPDSYLFPNDGAVGLTSARGDFAKLGHHRAVPTKLWHAPDLQVLLGPPDQGNQFDDDSIVGIVDGAPTTLPPVAVTAARRRGARRVTIELSVAQGMPARRASGRLAAGATLVVGRGGFSMRCDGRVLPALAIAEGLYGTLPEALRCRRASLRASTPLLIASNPARVRATLWPARRRVRIQIRASRPLQRAAVRAGRRRLALRVRKGRVAAMIPARKLRGANSVEARVAGRRYAAAIPPSLSARR